MAEIISLEDSLEELDLSKVNYKTLPKKAKFNKFKDKLRKLKKPYWIKVNSGKHKTSIGGVEKASNLEDLEKKHKELKKKFSNKKFIIQEEIRGEEIMIGMKQDKTFGKVLLIGTGGKLTETIKDTEFRVLPVNKKEIRKAIEEIKIYDKLEKKGIKKLTKLIYKFSKLAIKSNWKEVDINPIIVNNKETKVVDARISI